MLVETVESVLKGHAVPAELIIIDQSSVPNPALAAFETDRACDVRYIWQPIPGLSRARNVGIAAARHDLLVFTDDDMWVAADWWEALLRALLAAGPRGVVCGQVRPSEAPAAWGYVPSTKVDAEPAIYTAPGAVDELFGNHMAMYRSAFDNLGLFDERLGSGTAFPNAEDCDFGYRLLTNGYRIHYAPEAVLYHRGWRTEREYLPLRWTYGFGRGAYYAKHMRWRDRYMLRRLFTDIRDHLLPLPGLFLRDRRRAWGHLYLTAGLVYGAAAWLLTRGKSG
jgi:GT2 family glycosyltransferase